MRPTPCGFHAGPILDDEAQALGLPDARGAIVMSVDAESTAARAGLRAGDVIVEFDGHRIVDTRDLIARGASTRPGASAQIIAYRDGVARTRTVEPDRPVFHLVWRQGLERFVGLPRD